MIRLPRVVVATAFCVLSGPGVARADVPEVVQAIQAGDCKAAGAAINRGLEQGDAQAYFYAGFLFDATGCVESDPARAARYYRRAAELGNADAAEALGLSYGLGRGVERDYAEAQRWFAAEPGKPAASVVADDDARAVGYAATVAHAALGKLRYPPEMERGNIESSFEVVLVPKTGEISFRGARTGVQVGSNVPRTRVFTDAVRDAYEQALATIPAPAVLRPADAFVTPWKFAMRRGKYDERLAAQGAITIGKTTRLQGDR